MQHFLTDVILCCAQIGVRKQIIALFCCSILLNESQNSEGKFSALVFLSIASTLIFHLTTNQCLQGRSMNLQWSALFGKFSGDYPKGFDISQEYTFHHMKSLCPTYTYILQQFYSFFRNQFQGHLRGESWSREYELNKRFPTAI